ncbi:hypothetical protein KSC_017780 [Ktedonobacter sp. SOSP1-52]|uniref:hypothetical protein n=1 Tax=Ktedonobacter sp. SOSP1-52 TaxID=2778366 RepID=UPI001915D1C6|nr:hypothetical protein [Ktedonobacter sp. SOSP1-52]GHO62886.1 hypothetical protein KSC_017780 [Ktedonobacter sp. SOSP1-52]
MPKHARAFHSDHGNTQLVQSIVEQQQITGHGCQRACLLLLVPIGLRDQDGVTAVF